MISNNTIKLRLFRSISLFKLNTTGNNVKNGIKYLVDIPKSPKSVEPTGAHVKY